MRGGAGSDEGAEAGQADEDCRVGAHGGSETGGRVITSRPPGARTRPSSATAWSRSLARPRASMQTMPWVAEVGKAVFCRSATRKVARVWAMARKRAARGGLVDSDRGEAEAVQAQGQGTGRPEADAPVPQPASTRSCPGRMLSRSVMSAGRGQSRSSKRRSPPGSRRPSPRRTSGRRDRRGSGRCGRRRTGRNPAARARGVRGAWPGKASQGTVPARFLEQPPNGTIRRQQGKARGDAPAGGFRALERDGSPRCRTR